MNRTSLRPLSVCLPGVLFDCIRTKPRGGVFALSLLLSLGLSACGKTEQAGTPPAPAAETTAAATPDAEPTVEDPLAAGLKQAAAQQRALLIDFHAPWCYSCYYMSRNVLNGPEWQALMTRVVHVELDADSPIGARWKESYGVRALPSYLVLDASGAELGRLLGEQTRAEFYAQIEGLLAADPLERLRERALAGEVPALVAVLGAHHARDDASALDWFASLSAEQQAAARADGAAAAALARLELLRARQAGNVEGCVAAASTVFAGTTQCTDVYELGRLMACIESAPPALRSSTLQPLADRFRMLTETRVFGAGPLCADQRSTVLQTAELLDAIGDEGGADALLGRTIDLLRPQIEPDPRSDRNKADNLRVYLDAAERQSELDQWMQTLITAYPEDYVYPFRLGRSLLSRGQAAEALPYLEAAAQKAYGSNRLQVAEQRVKALLALGRADDARVVVGETLKANGPWFPEQAASLKALLPA